MQEGTITVEGCAIHYRQGGDEQAPPVFLLHGNSMSGRCFEPQLTSALTKRYRIIAIDLPGHGQSDRLTLADYNLPAYARLVSNVIKTMEIPHAVLVGWSLGGHILLRATAHLPQTAGLMLIGTPPLGSMQDALVAFLPTPASVIYQEQVSETEAIGFARACLHPESSLNCNALVKDIRSTHGLARLGLLQPGIEFSDEVSLARNLHIPFAMVHGEGEQLINLAYIEALNFGHLWRQQVQVMPGVGHTPHLEAPAAFNVLLGDFLEDCIPGH
jgi:pimeloyl-ACP methyl ester carboxylesterase